MQIGTVFELPLHPTYSLIGAHTRAHLDSWPNQGRSNHFLSTWAVAPVPPFISRDAFYVFSLVLAPMAQSTTLYFGSALRIIVKIADIYIMLTVCQTRGTVCLCSYFCLRGGIIFYYPVMQMRKPSSK